jgi:hypothetical protein
MIYFIIFKKNFFYFEDYINSINNKLEAIILFIDNFIDNNIIEIINNKNNVIIFVQKVPEVKFQKKYNNIFLLNTEQLSSKKNLNYIINQSKIYCIIDYSNENINILHINNIFNVIYFPYIYNSIEIYNLKKENLICSISPKNTPRRELIYNKLNIDNNFTITPILGFGRKRDELLFTHKILLNISANDDFNIFETIRCYRCLFNKMIIISEIKYKQDLIDYNKHILFCKLEDIYNLINDVINNYEYYYNLLELDDININLNNELINSKILYDTTENPKICIQKKNSI